MKFFNPVIVTDTTLLSHSVAETEAGLAVWAAGTTYTAGQRCFMTTGVHKIFESLQGANTGNDPTTSPTWWVEVGPTNRWKMFDKATGTSTVSSSDIVVVVDQPGANYTNSLALLDLVNVDSVTVEVLDSTDAVLWSLTTSLNYYGEDVVPDWYWYFFSTPSLLDSFVSTAIPYYSSSKLKVTLTKNTGAATCSIGTLAFGTSVLLGDTQWGVKLGILDFSKKEVDDFGVTTVLERVYARTMEASAFLQNNQVPRVLRALSAVRAKPVVWVGSDESLFSSTIVYGFYRSFDVVLESVGGSYCNLEIEGLS